MICDANNSMKNQHRIFVRVFLVLSSFLWNIMEAALLLKFTDDVILRKLFIFSIFWVSLTVSLNLNFFIMSSLIISSGLILEYLGVVFSFKQMYFPCTILSVCCFLMGWLGNPVFLLPRGDGGRHNRDCEVATLSCFLGGCSC